jgi:hypothetical protein
VTDVILPSELPGLLKSVERTLPCKVCQAGATLAGFADFSRDVYDYNRARGLVSGIPVPYYKCDQCLLGFTSAFDEWTDEDFRLHVYNDSYHLYDPRYAVERPTKTARASSGNSVPLFPEILSASERDLRGLSSGM